MTVNLTGGSTCINVYFPSLDVKIKCTVKLIQGSTLRLGWIVLGKKKEMPVQIKE
jgi:hypothetical protein